MSKNRRIKSVFLYGKPTKIKMQRFEETQISYTNLINFLIEKLMNDKKYFLDLLNNNEQSPQIRGLEKDLRHTHQLGSAYGQNAIDQAVKELHNHFFRIKSNLFGFIYNNEKNLIPYVSLISILNASIQDEDELSILEKLINNTPKTKSNENIIKEYRKAYNYISKLSDEQRSSNREYIRILFFEKLEIWKFPFVKKASIQLDSRVSKIERSHSTQEHFVVSMKLLNERKWVEFPVSTSRNGLRRMNQYKKGSLSATLRNGKVRF